MEIGKSSFVDKVILLLILVITAGCSGFRSTSEHERCVELYESIFNLPHSSDKPRGKSVDSEILSEMYRNKECLIGKNESEVRSLFGNPSHVFPYEWRYYNQGEYPCKKRCTWLSFYFNKEGNLQKFEMRGERINID